MLNKWGYVLKPSRYRYCDDNQLNLQKEYFILYTETYVCYQVIIIIK